MPCFQLSATFEAAQSPSPSRALIGTKNGSALQVDGFEAHVGIVELTTTVAKGYHPQHMQLSFDDCNLEREQVRDNSLAYISFWQLRNLWVCGLFFLFDD